MISLPAGSRIWLVVGITDMRNGFNGLASKVNKKPPQRLNTMQLTNDPLFSYSEKKIRLHYRRI